MLECEGQVIEGEDDDETSKKHVKCISSALQDRLCVHFPKCKRDTEETDA